MSATIGNEMRALLVAGIAWLHTHDTGSPTPELDAAIDADLLAKTLDSVEQVGWLSEGGEFFYLSRVSGVSMAGNRPVYVVGEPAED